MITLIEQQQLAALLFFIEVRAVIILSCWAFMVAACMIDFWSGTTTAKALGEPLMSHGFRRTVTKICDYARLLFFALMFDILGSLFDFYKLPFATIAFAVATIAIEGKSVIENSRRRKAHAADVPEVVKQIVQAATTKDGMAILERLTETLSNDNNKDKEQ